MRVTILDPDGGPWADLLDQRHAAREAAWISRGGSDFVNVSRIVWDMVQTIEGAADPSEHRDPMAVQIETGFVVEEMIADEFRKIQGWSKPPAIFRDGIGARPDGYNRLSRTVDEIKVTWMSAIDGLENPKALRFVLTAQAYAAMYGVERVRLHIWNVNADYRPPRPGRPITYILRIGRQEREQAWAGIRGHAVDRGWLVEGRDGEYRSRQQQGRKQR